MLDVQHLSRRFHGITVVHDVGFVLRPGEVLGYLGPNGSGKTTTLRMLTGGIDRTAPPFLSSYVRTGNMTSIGPIAHHLQHGFGLEDRLAIGATDRRHHRRPGPVGPGASGTGSFRSSPSAAQMEQQRAQYASPVSVGCSMATSCRRQDIQSR
jgi:energy-coupling factor transporter ATP-binding protein EcfA2